MVCLREDNTEHPPKTVNSSSDELLNGAQDILKNQHSILYTIDEDTGEDEDDENDYPPSESEVEGEEDTWDADSETIIAQSDGESSDDSEKTIVGTNVGKFGGAQRAIFV